MPGTVCTFQQQQSYIRQVFLELRALENETWDVIMKTPFLSRNVELRTLLQTNAAVLQSHEDPMLILAVSIGADKMRNNVPVLEIIDRVEDMRHTKIMQVQEGALQPQFREFVLGVPNIDGKGLLRRFQLIQRVSDARTEQSEQLLLEIISEYHSLLALARHRTGSDKLGVPV
ncbi:hypothetical protein N0V82_002410 [Gnomoniopsis sp. IMI 355080]|nr:hypothetical protein N0V82_002410 [Gnomoniopsis sp. IMI 355080]